MEIRITSDYLHEISQVLKAVKGVCRRDNCDHWDKCWQEADKIMKAAALGERDREPYNAVVAYDEYMGERLCTEGKENLIRGLLAALYHMDNPNLMVVHFDDDK